jgi:hypothetical protein
MKITGHYILNPKYKPTGNNRVDFIFKLGGGNDMQLSINNSPFRQSTSKELQDIRAMYKNGGEIKVDMNG